MDIYVLNSDLEQIAVIDSFRSLIWTKRYYTCGDFELCVPADLGLLQYLQPDFFLMREDDDSVMVIEKIEAQYDSEEGSLFIVSGRSLESLLTRRVCSSLVVINTNDVVQGIKALIEEQTPAGNTGLYRSFPNFVIDDSLTVAQKLRTQFTGDILLDAVSSICQSYLIGMKMTISGSNIVLSFYAGQEVPVIFSTEYDNLINSRYLLDHEGLANIAYIAGHGEGTSRLVVEMNKYNPQPTGLNRREIWVDARDVDDSNANLYLPLLNERGRQKLSEHEVSQAFEAEIEPSGSFQYKTDYNLGDVVTIQSEYGISAKPRIVEIIESWDEEGYKVVPTFDALEVPSRYILKDSNGKVLKDSTGKILCEGVKLWQTST